MSTYRIFNFTYEVPDLIGVMRFDIAVKESADFDGPKQAREALLKIVPNAENIKGLCSSMREKWLIKIQVKVGSLTERRTLQCQAICERDIERMVEASIPNAEVVECVREADLKARLAAVATDPETTGLS